MLSRPRVEDLLRAATRARTARDVLEHLRPSGPRPRVVTQGCGGLYFRESILRQKAKP